MLKKLGRILIGKPLNELNPKIRDHIALISIIAWVGLGADGLSSSSYGPAEAYLALGTHTSIAIYLAFATALTVFLISFAYNQVIELFPNGGGGYKVASTLLGPKFGVVSGSALIVDYILTIAVSTASGVDAVLSFLPAWFLRYKVELSILAIILLMILNLRGMKESIKILLPLFIGFLITHIFIIVAGILFHSSTLHEILPNAAHEASSLSKTVGWFVAISLFLKAYSMGGGTYTGLEAVSNNVNMLAEPRVRTGKLTMLYMAISLSFTAGGIILLYLLWHAAPVYGETLNATVFSSILGALHINHMWLTVILFFEAALLFVGANTGFLGSPAVMANMAVDKWLPRQFRELSDRLVTQNGVLLSGVASILVLLWARGEVSILVVLYSINVFLTFSLSLLGLCVYWVRNRAKHPGEWIRKLIVAVPGFLLCISILIITTSEKFEEGGWLTIVITVLLISMCLFIRKYYLSVAEKLKDADKLFESYIVKKDENTQIIPITDYSAKTAVFFVTKSYGAGIHTVLWVQRLFPGVFKQFVFITAGEIDSEAFSNEDIFHDTYRKNLNTIAEGFQYFSSSLGIPSQGYFSYAIDEVAELMKISEQVNAEFEDCVFFGSKLVFVDETWWSRLLHNNTVNLLQRRLHLQGIQMVIMPMKI